MGRAQEAWSALSRGQTKLTVVVEPVEGDLSILADLDEITVRVAHVATPFPAVIVLWFG